MATGSLDSMSLFMDEWNREETTALILRVAKSDQKMRERDLRMHPDEKPTTTLVEDVIRHIRRWDDRVTEDQIRKVMRGETL